MGLFRRRSKPEVDEASPTFEHPIVERTIYLHAAPGAVAPHLEGYAAIMGPSARDLPLVLDRSGAWLRLAFPIEGVHPWECVNLAFWLADLGDVVVVSAASATFPTHWLARSSDPGDLLEGWTEDGEPVTFHVPTNLVVRDDAEVVEPRCGVVERLTSLGVPLTGWKAVEVLTARSEDPGTDLNPDLTRSVADRRALQPFGLS